MKHFFKISAILLLCVFASCNKGDDDGGDDEMSNDELIIGTWTIDTRTVNGEQDQFDTCEALFAVRFTSDLDFTSLERSGDNCATNTQTPGTYTLNGNNLVVMQGSESIPGEILSLSSDNLSIRFTVDETVIENYRK